MKFTITREQLQRGLDAVAGSIPSKTTLPVLSNLLLEADSDSIRLTGTDLDIWITVSVPAKVDQPGATTVPAKKLQELARQLPDAPVKMTLQAGETLAIECDSSKVKFRGLSRDDFPQLPSIPFDSGWPISGDELSALIGHSRFAVSAEESRPILNGVLWQVKDGEMRMVATNGHKLAKICVPASTLDRPVPDAIIHVKGLDQAARLFGSSTRINVARSDSFIGFSDPDSGAVVMTRLIEGPYPNYEQVIPKDNDKKVVAQKAPLVAALRRISVVANEQTRRVKLQFAGAMLRFSVTTPDLGEANDEMVVDYAGEPLEIGFNSTYLLEVLKTIPGEEILMTFKAPERAATFEPVGENVPDYLCLVMPLRLLD